MAKSNSVRLVFDLGNNILYCVNLIFISIFLIWNISYYLRTAVKAIEKVSGYLCAMNEKGFSKKLKKGL